MNHQDLKGLYTGYANQDTVTLEIREVGQNYLNLPTVAGQFQDMTQGTPSVDIQGGTWDDTEKKLMFIRKNRSSDAPYQTYIGYLVNAKDCFSIAGYFTDSNTGKMYGWYVTKNGRR